MCTCQFHLLPILVASCQLLREPWPSTLLDEHRHLAHGLHRYVPSALRCLLELSRLHCCPVRFAVHPQEENSAAVVDHLCGILLFPEMQPEAMGTWRILSSYCVVKGIEMVPLTGAGYAV